jgi:hypothetical protein
MELTCYRCGSINRNENCPRCVALNRAPAEIIERICLAAALTTCVFRREAATTHNYTSDERPVVKQPNVVYLGHEEYLQVLRTMRNVPGARPNSYQIMGLLMIEVRLSSWLQVAYVEGL